jgi:PAS domain S-box-containing protein
VSLFVGQAVNLSRQHASQVAGFAALTIAAVGIISWWVSLPLLSSWGSGLATVKPTTALCLAALGLVLVLASPDSRIAVAAGLTVAAVGALDLLDLFGIDSGINRLNRLLVPQAAVPGPETLFRIINGVPVALELVGGSLALSCFERHRFAATTLSGVAGVMVTWALLSDLTGNPMLFGSVGLPTPLTAIGMLCVVSSIILRIGTVPAFRRPRPLWQLLIVLGCAIIAPLLLFGVYTGLRATDAQLNQVRNDLTGDAHTLSSDVDRQIIGEIESLQALAGSPSLREGDFAAFQRQAEAWLSFRQGSNIMLVDRNMQQVVNTWVPFGTPLEKAAVPEPLERALITGKPQIASLFIVPVTQQLVLGIIVPVQIDGENRYALVRPVDQRALASLVARRRQRPGSRVVISDAEHLIIVRSEQKDAIVGRTLLAAQWHCPGRGGVFEFADADRRPLLGAYACSDLSGWQTIVWEPKALLEAPVWTLWRTLGWLALVAFILVVVLALWLGRIIARAVGHAARAAAALGEGGPLPLSATPVAEVNTLMDELRGAAARRRAAEKDLQLSRDQLQVSRDQLQVSRDQLQVSRDQLQLSFDATRLGWWQYDPLRSTAAVDARFKEVFDVTADEIPMEDVIKRVHPDDRERFLANRAVALDPANPKPYVHHEYRVRRRDGTVRWVEGNGLAHFEGAGPQRHVVSFGGTVQDVTERREREEKEHLLMREINHRAKNMLSVVASIAHQTAARNPDDFVERFSERIQALSANQDLLVRSEWSGVEIADLVRVQLAHFADLIGSRIALQGPALRLTPASAQAVGLALHELATNAGKYGALSCDKGRVDISWGTAGDTLTMSWTERGGPLVSAPQRRGFGSTVIEAMAARSVGGEVHLDYAPSGVVWRLTCPAANALEPGPGMGTGVDSDAQAQ